MKFPEQFRITEQSIYGPHKAGDPWGIFLIPAAKARKRKLFIIATDGENTAWEHVSISLPDFHDLCASWDEMCLVKDLFWDDTQCIIQFHPAKSEYVNFHPGVLHLWRCRNGVFPMPPRECV